MISHPTLPHRIVTAWRRAPVTTALAAAAFALGTTPAGIVAGYLFGTVITATWTALFGPVNTAPFVEVVALMGGILGFFSLIPVAAILGPEISKILEKERRNG